MYEVVQFCLSPIGHVIEFNTEVCIKLATSPAYSGVSLFTGLDYWTGLLDSPKLHKMPFPAIFSVGQKLNMLIDSPKLLA